MNNETQTEPITVQPRKPSTTLVLDEFMSALIVAYEQALENGIRPHSALAVMIDMVSSEAARLGVFSPASFRTADDRPKDGPNDTPASRSPDALHGFAAASTGKSRS